MGLVRCMLMDEGRMEGWELCGGVGRRWEAGYTMGWDGGRKADKRGVAWGKKDSCIIHTVYVLPSSRGLGWRLCLSLV